MFSLRRKNKDALETIKEVKSAILDLSKDMAETTAKIDALSKKLHDSNSKHQKLNLPHK